MPDETPIRSAAREIVASMAGSAVSDSEAIISSGLIDSLSILKLISRMEKKLDIAIPTDNFQPLSAAGVLFSTLALLALLVRLQPFDRASAILDRIFQAPPKWTQVECLIRDRDARFIYFQF
jgi:acyl carrier protein